MAFSQSCRWPSLDTDRAEGCIRSGEHAFSQEGGLAVLVGNIALNGCVVKTAGVDDALMVFERVRSLIAQRVWDGIPSGIRLTASIGVSVGGDSANREHLLTEAVGAMQVAKRTGRDRISFR